jgi:hypothetical protein
MPRLVPFLIALLLPAAPMLAQDRKALVHQDRERFSASPDWVYNDLAKAQAAAQAANKPLFVVFRCIPCEACQEFDDDVARRDPIIRDLLDKFICVRIVQANTIDLARFQHDFDQSFAAYFLAPDLTILGRYGTRSGRPEFEDISLHGLRKALEAALEMHASFDGLRAALAGKQVKPGPFKLPTDYPSLAGRYGPTLDYEGAVVRSCMHCHQIGEAERLLYRARSEPIPDKVLFPYPDPSVLGLLFDPREKATVTRVAEGSIAEAAGLRPGDSIETLEGQPLLSIADFQWVLHNAPATAHLHAKVRRWNEKKNLTLKLPEGWRQGDLSWRATTWELRRMALGGMRLDDLSDSERDAANLSRDSMALRVRHAGKYDPHDAAHRAGVKDGDIITAFDGFKGRFSETALIARSLQTRKPGETVTVELRREGSAEPITLTFAVQ